MDWYNGNFR